MNFKETNDLSVAIENLKFKNQSPTMKCVGSIPSKEQVKIVCFFVTNLLDPARMHLLARENEEVCVKCINSYIKDLEKEYKEISGQSLSLKKESCKTECELMSRTSSDKGTTLIRTTCMYSVK